jgi:diguanylate cyclase (GGDEF)-like protein/PAS domain S-box-containing protein
VSALEGCDDDAPVAQRKRRRSRTAFETFIIEIERRILRGDALPPLLQFICDELASQYGYPIVQISLKKRDGSVSIRTVAGRCATFVDDIDVRWDDGPNSHGPTGRAIRTGTIQSSDVRTDPGFAPWRDRALALGLRSVIALPLLRQREVLGALTLFSCDPNGFHDPADQQLGSFADQIAMSVAAAAGQRKIRLQTAALEATANAICVTDCNGVIEWVNPAFTTLTGWTPDEAIGQTPRILRSGNHSSAFYRQMWESLAQGQVWRGEMYNRRKSGELYVEEQTITPVRDENGTITHFVAVKQDISDRKRQEEKIRHLALHDQLTNLPNRRAFDATLERVLYAARNGESAAVLIIDVDDFKLVNDSAGHPAGDRFLFDLAEVLQRLLRPGDLVARFGGDEFAVILRRVGEEMAFEIAERLRRRSSELSFEHEGITIASSVSVGMAMIDSAADAKTLVAHADAALYAAKQRGKNRTVVYPFGPVDFMQGAEATSWINRIKSALREDRMTLHYQPVIRLGNGATEHFEALVRMHENGEVIFPDHFLPVAERYGLMSQIDRWVFDRVLRTLLDHDSPRIFANLSGASLCDENLMKYIEQQIRESGLAPGRLAFEITETVAVNDFGAARSWIHRLKELGCVFALDDFGIGFSSLGYLRALAVDYVKIDRTFIRDVDTNPTNRALVQAVNTVAHTLGKEVIAEGVETAAHCAVLLEIGIEHGQGYHWGKPREMVHSAGAESDRSFHW